MLSVKLVDQFLPIPEILRSFSTSLYVTVTRQLYEIMELPVASIRDEDSVDFPFVRVVHDCQLRFRWQLAGGWRSIAVEQSDVEHVVLPDRIRKVYFVSILIDDLTYCVRSCPFLIQHLSRSCRPEVPR